MASLQEQFKLLERQAQAILDMRLRRLTGLEEIRLKLNILELIAYIEGIKRDSLLMKKSITIVRNELIDIRERYGDERRSEIQLGGLDDIEDEDLIPEEQIVITLSHNNYIKRLPVST